MKTMTLLDFEWVEIDNGLRDMMDDLIMAVTTIPRKTDDDAYLYRRIQFLHQIRQKLHLGGIV